MSQSNNLINHDGHLMDAHHIFQLLKQNHFTISCCIRCFYLIMINAAWKSNTLIGIAIPHK